MESAQMSDPGTEGSQGQDLLISFTIFSTLLWVFCKPAECQLILLDRLAESIFPCLVTSLCGNGKDKAWTGLPWIRGTCQRWFVSQSDTDREAGNEAPPSGSMAYRHATLLAGGTVLQNPGKLHGFLLQLI